MELEHGINQEQGIIETPKPKGRTDGDWNDKWDKCRHRGLAEPRIHVGPVCIDGASAERIGPRARFGGPRVSEPAADGWRASLDSA